MELLFVKSESTFSYFEATCHYIDKHGKPLALYSDKAGVFRVNNKHATGGEGHTQLLLHMSVAGNVPVFRHYLQENFI